MIGFYAAGAMGQGAPPEAWTETFLTTLTDNGGNWTGGYTTRVVIPASAVTAASKIRLTLRGGAANFTVQGARLALAATSGDPYDYAAAPEVVTAGGNPSFVIPAGNDIVIDPVELAIPAGRGLVFAFYATAGSARYAAAPSGWGSYYKGGSDLDTVNTTMDGSEARIYFVRRIECVAA